MRIITGMPMYYGAKPKLFEYARKMRYAPTDAERLMWQILTSEELLLHKFRRQHPIARYIADFYRHPLLLVIELDGGYHIRAEQQEVDDIRDGDMQQFGITILKFTNEEVISQPEMTLIKLNDLITKLTR